MRTFCVSKQGWGDEFEMRERERIETRYIDHEVVKKRRGKNITRG